jgi:hypothetical protein
MTRIFRSMPVAGAAILAVSLSAGATPVAAQNGRNGVVHIQKDCKDFDGTPGTHCTITASDLAEIPVNSIVYYDQANGIPKGMLDSNVVLVAPDGSKAIGRCTLDGATGSGLCTFSDGTGLLAGFTARVEVSYLGGVDMALYGWDGTYSFKPLPAK